MNVAVLGSGAREHALATKLAESNLCDSLYVLPGNDGMTLQAHPKIKIKNTDPFEFAGLLKSLKSLKTDFVVVGPDDLLEQGVADFLTKEGFKVFGPKKNAAKLEWSKSFAKEIMVKVGVPTAKSILIHAYNSENKRTLCDKIAAELGGYPFVLKYDGLALGKGVRICESEEEAAQFLESVFSKKKSTVVVAEEFLTGHEISLFAISDGKTYAVLEPACDYKKLEEGNRGPNTGGMGAYSPVPWMSKERRTEIAQSVFFPVLEKMKEMGTPFEGLLYAGLIINQDSFYVLEFNARFGDPETQVILPRLESDLLPVLYGAATGELEKSLERYPLRWSKKACVNVVLASPGYPENPKKGLPIHMEPALFQSPLAKIYFAGVKKKDDALETSGGRVMGISVLGQTLGEAHRTALEMVGFVNFEQMQYRRDIGRVTEI